MNRHLVLFAALAGTALGGTTLGFSNSAAHADQAAAPLPAFAFVPPPSALLPAGTASAAFTAPAAEPESIYHGLYIGTELFGVGGRGIKGGFGGDVYAGYERLLQNGVLVGMQGSTGYAPALLARPGLHGFDFSEVSAQVAYPMGRLTPFLTAGLVVAKPVVGRGLADTTTDSVNDLLNGGGDLSAAPRVGAGFAYALTSNTSVSLGVSVGRGLGAGFP